MENNKKKSGKKMATQQILTSVNIYKPEGYETAKLTEDRSLNDWAIAAIAYGCLMAVAGLMLGGVGVMHSLQSNDPILGIMAVAGMITLSGGALVTYGSYNVHKTRMHNARQEYRKRMNDREREEWLNDLKFEYDLKSFETHKEKLKKNLKPGEYIIYLSKNEENNDLNIQFKAKSYVKIIVKAPNTGRLMYKKPKLNDFLKEYGEFKFLNNNSFKMKAAYFSKSGTFTEASVKDMRAELLRYSSH